jgi:hypothetical protein
MLLRRWTEESCEFNAGPGKVTETLYKTTKLINRGPGGLSVATMCMPSKLKVLVQSLVPQQTNNKLNSGSMNH